MANIIKYKTVHCMCKRVAITPDSLTNMRSVYCLSGADKFVDKMFLVRMSSTASKMNAWQIHQYGAIDQLTLNTSAHIPVIKSPTELLIKVHATSVNPIDTKMLGGYGRALINVLRKRKGVITSGTEFPLTLGRDFSGTVMETGQAVSKFEAGDEVWGTLSAERFGAHAKYTLVSQDHISKKPDNISHIEAASLPYVVATTWAALCTVGELSKKNAPRRRILVLGGSGGIGTFAIQLAKAWGMHVTSTCGTDAVDLVRSLGADVIDYKTKDVWSELKRVQQFDYILDTLGRDNTNKAIPFLKSWQGAQLITLISPLLANSDQLGLVPGLLRTAVSAGVETVKSFRSGRSVRWAIFMPDGTAMETVRQLVEAGQIKPIVQQVFPFSEVPLAFKKVTDGHLRGKIVVDALKD